MGTDLTADSTQPFRNAPARTEALAADLAALLDARGEVARERAWKASSWCVPCSTSRSIPLSPGTLP